MTGARDPLEPVSDFLRRVAWAVGLALFLCTRPALDLLRSLGGAR